MERYPMSARHGGNIYAVARQQGVRPESIFDFSANINPLGFPAGVKKVLSRAGIALCNYPDRDAYDCISALARYHRLPRSCFTVGNGSTEFIYALPDILTPKRVLIVVPAFTEYAHSYRYRSAAVASFTTSAEDSFLPDTSALLARMRRGYDALYLCNPGNPAGTLMPQSDMLEIVRTAHALGTTVVLDEAFIDFTESHSLKRHVLQYGNLVILRSMTKFFGLPGLRIGYVIAHPDMIAAISARRQPWTMNALAQRAVREALEDRTFIRKTRMYVNAARRRLVRDLERIDGLTVIPGHANFLLVRIASHAFTAAALYQKLLRHNILIRTCEDFQGLDSRYFRIAVKKTTENDMLVRWLKKILVKKPATV